MGVRRQTLRLGQDGFGFAAATFAVTAGAWSLSWPRRENYGDEDSNKRHSFASCQAAPLVSEKNLVRYQTFPKVLGVGTYGKVVLGRDLVTGSQVAVKCVRSRHVSEGEVAAMREISARGGHENILKLIDVVQEPKRTLIVTELVAGEEMYERLARDGPFAEEEAAALAKAMAEGVAFLHEQVGMAHCDLKPENVIVQTPKKDGAASLGADHARVDETGTRLKIVDFGSANILATRAAEKRPDDRRLAWAGTNVYRPPESFGETVEDLATPLGKEADMFALGCILFICLYGAHPFNPYEDLDESEICGRIKYGEWRFLDERSEMVSPLAKDLVRRLLDIDPRTRATASDVLQHPWLKAVATPAAKSPAATMM
ncbi:Protein kinase, putative [Hondaea fermentalgiana]|uniref:Protein kinase, putative n=1 Tax=Hondaea fermentalgiana TaxID=2315210 RepID=A0A2R5GF20_9STRA|nr:Protein kinase, putative [Hondaea fermentalgiana]|eukprot:GBG26851.1 Protein kinase, putative [Hondaea fermentalgiana]